MAEPLITEEMVEVAHRQIELALQFVPNGQRLPDGNYRYGKNEIMNFHNECSRAAEKAIRAVAPMILERAAKVADAHKGSAQRERNAKRRFIARYTSTEQWAEISAEERGEDIASEIIAAAIRALAAQAEEAT